MTLRHWDVLLEGDIESADEPLDLDTATRILTIAAASGSARGTMSAAHYTLLNAALAGDVDSLAGLLSQLIRRDGNGDAAVRAINAALHAEVGTSSAGRSRIQVTTPTAAGHLQIDPVTGRLYVYVGGVATAAEVATETPRVIEWTKSAPDAAPADETDEFPFFGGIGFDIEIVSASFYPAASIISDNTNYAGINIGARNATNSASALLVSATTQVSGLGNFTQWTPKTLPISGSSYVLQAGWYLTLEIPKAGAGVTIPAGTFKLGWQIPS